MPTNRNTPALIIFGGLPGTGKTTLARRLARDLEAVLVRIDTIEQAILRSSLAPPSVEDAGYRAGYSVAAENLHNGRLVVADSVNPLDVTREAWRRVAEEAGAPFHEVEVRCTDTAEHRRRVEQRAPDIPGMVLPTWKEVLERRYEPWTSKHLIIDTAGRSVDDCCAAIVASIAPS